MADGEVVKLYFDYKSPFSYLAKTPAFDLPARYAVDLRWIPFVLRIKGKGERSVSSEHKAKYSYLDARRWANKQGGFRVMGPQKVYDSTPALVGGLFAEHRGFFRPYTDLVYRRFFERALEIDQPEAIAGVIDELGHSGADYLAYRTADGARAFEACQAEAADDHVFGVPLFVFRGEPFWGHDRVPLLEERLADAGLRRAP